MIYLINTFGFAFIAAIWSKTGWANIFIALAFAALTAINAVGAYPVLSRFVAF